MTHRWRSGPAAGEPNLARHGRGLTLLEPGAARPASCGSGTLQALVGGSAAPGEEGLSLAARQRVYCAGVHLEVAVHQAGRSLPCLDPSASGDGLRNPPGGKVVAGPERA